MYSYETKIQRITSLRVVSLENLGSRAAHTQLAVHPTQPYLLSVYGFEVKLWDWDLGWECIQTFENEEFMTILQVAFNPKDTFATASMDCTVEVCHPPSLNHAPPAARTTTDMRPGHLAATNTPPAPPSSILAAAADPAVHTTAVPAPMRS